MSEDSGDVRLEIRIDEGKALILKFSCALRATAAAQIGRVVIPCITKEDMGEEVVTMVVLGYLICFISGGSIGLLAAGLCANAADRRT
jgi:hypothetical protein